MKKMQPNVSNMPVTRGVKCPPHMTNPPNPIELDLLPPDLIALAVGCGPQPLKTQHQPIDFRSPPPKPVKPT